MCCHHLVAEIAYSYLQSLEPVLFGAFYYVLSELHDCVLHTLDETHGILSDIDEPDVDHAWPSDD